MTTGIVEIKARIARVLPSEGVYRVDVDIIDAVNIDVAVLVFAQKDDVFNHVAMVYDLETWPTQPDPHFFYYRGRGVKAFFKTLNDAIHFEEVTRSRLKFLTNSWGKILSDFSGTEIVHYTSL
jgi:hypothetical protein